MNAAQPTSAPAARLPWPAYTLGQLTVMNLGFYAAMSVLAVHLAQVLRFSPSQVAAVLLASSLGLRASRFAVAPLMDRLPVRTGLLLGLGTAILGYLGLYAFSGFAPVLLSVFLIGTGYGSNGLLVTTLSSFAPTSGAEGRMRHIYAFQYSLATCAAAIGPALVSWWIIGLGTQAPFLFSALMLAISGLIVLALPRSAFPRLEAPERFYARVRQLLARRQTLAMMGSVACAWFLYTQKFAILPLFLGGTLGHGAWMGGAMLLFSTTILLTAIPLSAWLARRGWESARILRLGFLLYGSGYLAVGCWSTPPVLLAAIVAWAVAEGLSMPAINNLIAQSTAPSERLAGFSLAALPTALGEFLGMSAGVEGYRISADAPQRVFLALGVIGLICAVAQTMLYRRAMTQGGSVSA